MARQRNLAARAGRWSASHRKTAIVEWLAFVVAAVVLGGAAGINYQRDEDVGTGESGRADKIIAAGFADHASAQVLVQSRGSVTVDDPRFGAALDDAARHLAAKAMRRAHDDGWVVVARGDLSGSAVCHRRGVLRIVGGR